MPARVISRKFFSQFVNGEDFTTSPADVTDHLSGNVLELVRCVMQWKVEWRIGNASGTTWGISGATGGNEINAPSVDFIASGFNIGDTIYYSLTYSGGSPVVTDTRNIVNITSTVLTFDGPALTSGSIVNALILGITPLRGCYLKHNLIENAESTNYINRWEGTEQQFNTDGFGAGAAGSRVTTFEDGVSVGKIKGWVTGPVKTRFVSDNDPIFAGQYSTQIFETQQDILILPHTDENLLADFKLGIPPDFFDGPSCLKYVTEATFLKSINEPNTGQIGEDDTQSGNTGWFGENRNGNPNKYSINSITYTVAGQPSASVNVLGTTHVVIVVDTSDSNFVASQKFGVVHTYIPSSSDYVGSEEDFQTVWLYDAKYSVHGAGPVSSSIIQNLESTAQTASSITIEFDLVFTAPQRDRVELDEDYCIAVFIGENGLSNVDSDRVTLLADLNTYLKSVDILGLMTFNTHNIYPLHRDISLGGYSDFKGWLQDVLVSKYTFSLDLDKGTVINKIKHKVVAWNDVTNDFFEFVSPSANYEFDLSGQVQIIDSGYTVQKIEIDDIRDFNVNDTIKHNRIFITTNAVVGNNVSYELRIPYRIPYQEWLENLNVDTVFYDTAEENKGLNDRSNRYSNISNYKIRIMLELELDSNDGTTVYRTITEGSDVQDWDLPVNHTVTFTLKDQSGVDLNGKISENENTKIEVLIDDTGGAITDLTDYWAAVRIETDENTGGDPYEITTEYDPDNLDNLLSPITGETRLKMSLVGGDILLECETEVNNLTAGQSYDIYARVGTRTAPGAGVPAGAKQLEDGTYKLLEDGQFKIIE